MPAFEVVGAYKQNPGAVISTMAPLETQKLEVKASEGQATLQNMWASNATGGIVRVRSPRMHDDVQGIRARVAKETPDLLLPYSVNEPLYQTDTLTFETTGGEAEVDMGFLLFHYTKLEGSEGNLKSWAEVEPLIDKIMGVEVSVKGGALGKWGAPVALNTSMDIFNRPAYYAILGYQVDQFCGAIVVQGTDVGPLRNGGPGHIDPDQTAEWFIKLSEEAKEPAIPVFSSQNVGQVYVECATAVAEAERHVTFTCARLKS